jgi:hypothetical protein
MKITTLNIRRKIAEISQSLLEKEEQIEELESMAQILKHRMKIE